MESLSKSKIEVKRKKQKWIQIQSKYHHNHDLNKPRFKHILSKFHKFFFHQRLKKEETEAVTKGQLISECLLGVIDFRKKQRKI